MGHGGPRPSTGVDATGGGLPSLALQLRAPLPAAADRLENLMSRIQLAVNVDDVDAAVEFYCRLFAAAPAKRRPGYANFALEEPALKLVLIENPGNGGSINHLGVEVA